MPSNDDELQRYRDFVIDIHSRVYDKGAAYTNLIMFGGYAGLFTIWGLARDHLTASATAWAGLSLILSLAGFISFEIYKMVLHTAHARRIADLLKQPKPLAEQMEDVRNYQRSVTEREFLFQMPVWVCSLGFCILTALSAAVTLVWNFAAILWADL